MNPLKQIVERKSPLRWYDKFTVENIIALGKSNGGGSDFRKVPTKILPRLGPHYLPQMKLPAEMMKLAQHIIRTKSVEFDPSMLEDHYRAALVRILQKKRAKRHTPPPAAAPSRENVINLMDALRRSIPAESPSPRPQRPAVAAKAASPKGRKARHRSA